MSDTVLAFHSVSTKPDQAQLAADTGWSVDTVKRAESELEDLGLVVISRQRHCVSEFDLTPLLAKLMSFIQEQVAEDAADDAPDRRLDDGTEAAGARKTEDAAVEDAPERRVNDGTAAEAGKTWPYTKDPSSPLSYVAIDAELTRLMDAANAGDNEAELELGLFCIEHGVPNTYTPEGVAAFVPRPFSGVFGDPKYDPPMPPERFAYYESLDTHFDETGRGRVIPLGGMGPWMRRR